MKKINKPIEKKALFPITLNFRITELMKNEIKKIAKKQERNESYIVRKAISEYFKRNEENT